ncbi:UDP-N-acetylmuramoylalanine--D-glutamate ligase [Candidatus Xenohaliotis californiensis]|uniref:UDP-N-acetylmuramoylalanine--D-glutamate ligase n=1 Tax=Candidatus Xenohaliotis californiensis TaxID=84677 RepID=A0ABM9N8N7_9RICK|nr:UDP-N-acetylmuramoylalanine--D-glutamate ligase [Candidatus Xenohaliotis californiensis]
MIILDSYKDNNIAIFGMGVTGIAMAESFVAGGANVFLLDDRDVSLIPDVLKIIAKYPDANIFTKHYTLCNWPEIDVLALSPGIPLFVDAHDVVNIARKNNCRIIGDVELFWEAKKDSAKFICITGTNGKSTTASLIVHILKLSGISVELLGNVGIAVLSANYADIYVLELSSFQLDLLDNACFDISILLNITPDHLDRYDSFQSYCNSKKRILHNQKNLSILNVDDRNCMNIVSTLSDVNIQNKIIFVSPLGNIEADIIIKGDSIVSIKENKILAELLSNNIFPTSLNKLSILAAYCSCIGFTAKNNIVTAISSFKPLEHRMEIVCEYNNILFINDSKATNIESALFALSSLRNIYWIAGGKDKNCNLNLALDGVNFNNVLQCFTIGEMGEVFSNILLSKGVNSVFYENLDKAFAEALKTALLFGEPVTILFSPGFASFDQWQDFNKRGRAFKNLIMELV